MPNGLTEREINLVGKHFDLTRGHERPLALWIIGRPAAGKTSTARILRDVLCESGHRVELIDGDAVRSFLNGFGYSVTDRSTVFEKYILLNQLFQERGILPVTATIAGFHQFREMVRTRLKNPKFIYLDCAFDVAAKRDQKGIYSKALAGQLKNFFDVDIPFETPHNYEMKIDSATLQPHTIVSKIIGHFYKSGILIKPSRP
ncbi:MAG: adenylyl-sulfate kinase [Deltaproteobacteria bacterium]|nr:adenylyl-sulfate kinase [Deltaproteobacteria bacterium]